MNGIIIIGAGIAGLTLALSLHAKGLRVRVIEAAPNLQPLGVGINIQPYATRVLSELGLLETLQRQAITTQEMVFFNRYGQRIYSLPLGLNAEHDYPQLSIHRGVLQNTLLEAAYERLGPDFLITGHSLLSASQDQHSVKARLRDNSAHGVEREIVCDALIGADGVNSSVYRALYPEGPHITPTGVHMWRGVSVAPKFLSGASMVRVGVPEHGKLVIYPIRDNVNAQGDQLINWVAELDTRLFESLPGFCVKSASDFTQFFASRVFDWLDIPQLLKQTSQPIIQMPMADRDPLPQWRSGRMTLIGDAAHPMVPVGSNGAGQAILDACCLARNLAQHCSIEEAFASYEDARRQHTSAIVLGDRQDLPDQLITEVDSRSKGMPFTSLDSLMSVQEAHRLAIPDYHSVLLSTSAPPRVATPA
ncbi:FAD-dependent monooxygenase [Pseudomonas fluorescens]|uniref:FAD-dependent monooxygenase n=1 Tax=Pseudomonas fluorescens TaxID=294 RepID=UPI0017865B23|nr:FAD-dependent monooxygenase [Pseudomonas fluorescens]